MSSGWESRSSWPDVLPRALARFTAKFPETRVVPRQLSTAAQFAALRDETLDVGLVRERLAGPEFDAMLVSRENLGVLIASDLADELMGPDGVQLDALHGLKWVGFPRAGSPAWFDELTSILRSHGIDVGPPVPEDLELVVAVKFASVSSGNAFALAPPRQLEPVARCRRLGAVGRQAVGAQNLGGLAGQFTPTRCRTLHHHVRRPRRRLSTDDGYDFGELKDMLDWRDQQR